MAALIAATTAGGNSADIALADGAGTVIQLFCSTLPLPNLTAAAVVRQKNSGGYTNIATLDRNQPSVRIVGPLTFAVALQANALAHGVDRD